MNLHYASSTAWCPPCVPHYIWRSSAEGQGKLKPIAESYTGGRVGLDVRAGGFWGGLPGRFMFFFFSFFESAISVVYAAGMATLSGKPYSGEVTAGVVDCRRAQS